MDRSEPALVPEWLKNSGSVSGSNSASQHSASSSAQSDRTSSTFFNSSSSSNGSATHEKNPSAYPRSYSSSGRSHRDRDWDADLLDICSKERSFWGDHRDHSLTPSGGNSSPFVSRTERDALRRSRSSLSGKQSELRPRRLVPDLRRGTTNDHRSSTHKVGSTHKVAFERDFPSLGAEERLGGSDIVRASSPSLSSAIQSLPMGSSSAIGRDGWTSALAEVPATVGSNSMGLSSAKQSAPANLATLGPTTTIGLNMAETLAQAPLRARTAPQLSVETQRLEELAIKQSRQLIPMMPLMPKISVLNSEKPKPKPAARNDVNQALKTGQHQGSSSLLVNHSSRGGNAIADVPKTGHVGKLLVLRPAREKNGIASSTKDSLSPTNAAGVANSPSAVGPAVASSAISSPVRNLNNHKHTAVEHKPSLRPAMHSSAMEKRSSLSHAQSRNDFFNLMRKKTTANSSSSVTDPTPVLLSNVSESSGELIVEISSAPVTPQANDAPSSDLSCPDWSMVNGTVITSNGDACEESPTGSPHESPRGESQGYLNNGQKHSSSIETVYSDEEEVAFLRSLGWEENAGEEEGLTEEEINAFYKKLQLMPSLKTNPAILQQKILSPLKSQVGSFDSVSSGLGSSDSDSDA